MKIKVVITVVAIVAMLVVGAYLYTIFTAPQPIPGEIRLSKLTISPGQVTEGESVTISVNATNVGQTKVTGTITLRINGTVVTSQEITLAGGESKTVTFPVTRTAGKYSVDVGGLTGMFTVLQPPPKITLTIITRHDTTIWTLYEPVFLASQIAKTDGVTDITWISPTEAGLWIQVMKQGGVDVAWGGGPTLFDTLVENGLLEPLEDDSYAMQMANQINDTLAGGAMKRFNEKGKTLWVAAAISSFGFTVNHAFLNKSKLPVPHRWEDLANETYGKLLPLPTISMGNAPGTTSNTRIYEIILQAFGWEEGWSILTRMAGNAGIYGGSVETQSAVEIGEVGVGMSIDFYGFTTILKNKDCEYIMPEGETIINGDPIALVKGTQHKKAAQDFIGWVLSLEGQAIWLNPNINRMPVRGDVFKTAVGQQRPDLYYLYNKTIQNIGIPFSDAVAISYEQSLLYYFEAVFRDEHESLVDAWTALIKARTDGKLTPEKFKALVAKLGAPVTWTQDGIKYTFNMTYAQSINERIYKDSLFRSQMQSIWRSAAEAKYKAVLSEVKALY